MKPVFFVIFVCLFLAPLEVSAGEWFTDGKTNCKAWDEYSMPKETISWSGKCADGYASGPGNMVLYHDGKEAGQYKGETVKGKLDGIGTLTLANGEKYEGGFAEGKQHGKGTLTSTSGNKYEGDFVNGKFHGNGTFTTAKGNKYSGDFANNLPNGKGTFTCPNGKQFTGDFKNGLPVGFDVQCN